MIDLIEYIKDKRTVLIAILISLTVGVCGTLFFNNATASNAYNCPKLDTSIENDKNEVTQYTIDIKGAVQKPGVYKVDRDLIVNDVLAIAGGLRDDADTSNLNLSKKVTNEMVITVFTKEEVANSSAKKEAITESSNDKVNINTAAIEELTTLPGIGEAKAKIIIEYRESCGGFTNKEELKNIKGIGDSIYEKIEEYITI